MLARGPVIHVDVIVFYRYTNFTLIILFCAYIPEGTFFYVEDLEL